MRILFINSIFRFGILLWEILHPGIGPWDGEIEIEKAILSGNRPLITLPLLNEESKPAWMNIIEKCWNKVPALRPSASSLVCIISKILTNK